MAAVANSSNSAPNTSVSTWTSYVKVDSQTFDTIRQEGSKRLAGLKPWNEFFDRNRVSVPKTFKEFTTRLNQNVQVYQNNYIFLSLIIAAYALITNLWLLIGAAFCLIGSKWIGSLPANEPVKLLGTQFTQTQLYIGLGIFGLVFLWLSGAPSTIFWMLTTAGLLLVVHGGLMEPPVEVGFTDAV
ncbi:PRA1 family protein-domain-containing protein [Cladochytrium replicatum]|nr:PRA1 family protein-domain-containing protein [Cladochytrium replicatum]